MGRRRSRTLTEVELQFMQVIWDVEEASAEEVRDAYESPLDFLAVRWAGKLATAWGKLKGG